MMDSSFSFKPGAGPLAWPPIDDAVRRALLAAYTDGSWGQYNGPHVPELERRLAAQHHVPHALTCASGTIAVELALRGVGVTAGDEVLLAAYDFPGNFRAIEAIGARPVLVDIEPDSWCLAVDAAQAACSDQTRAVIVSHLHGSLADMPALCGWARQRNIAVIEDACQVSGASVVGRPAGSWGDVGVLSFGGSKLLTAGRGGAVVTPRDDIQQRIKIWCDRGNHAVPLSELQAAVLLPQLDQLADRNAQRRRNVERLISASADWPLLRPLPLRPERGEPSFYKLGWQLLRPSSTLRESRQMSERSDSEAGGEASDLRTELLAALWRHNLPFDSGFRGFVDRSTRRCRKSGMLDQARRAATDTIVMHHPVLLAEPPVIEHLIRLTHDTVKECAERLA